MHGGSFFLDEYFVFPLCLVLLESLRKLQNLAVWRSNARYLQELVLHDVAIDLTAVVSLGPVHQLTKARTCPQLKVQNWRIPKTSIGYARSLLD